MLNIAIDPNILEAASDENKHWDSIELLKKLREERRYIQLVVDDGGVIQSEYVDLSRRLNGLPAMWLAEVLKYKKDMLKPIRLSKNQIDFSAYGCSTPVEPQLLSLCMEPHYKIKLIVVTDSEVDLNIKQRGSHNVSVVDRLRSELISDFSIWTAASASEHISYYAKYPDVYPSNLLSLQEYLRMKDYRECETLEFKQPNNGNDEADYLTPSILEEVMQAICGFANVRGGIVLLGISEDENQIGRIKGFSLKYQTTKDKIKPKNEGQVLSIIAEMGTLLKSINTMSCEYIRYELLKINDNKYIMVFNVEKARGSCLFRGKKYYRHGNITKGPL